MAGWTLIDQREVHPSANLELLDSCARHDRERQAFRLPRPLDLLVTVVAVQDAEGAIGDLDLPCPSNDGEAVIDHRVRVPQSVCEDASAWNQSVGPEASRKHGMELLGSVGLRGWL